MYTRCKNGGLDGVFIPLTDFEKGLWLEEDQKLLLQQKVKENDKLIQELQAEIEGEIYG